MTSYLDTFLGGQDAFTKLATAFTQPAVDANRQVSVVSTAALAVGLGVYVAAGGSYVVVSVDSSSLVTLKNTGASGNASPAATVPAGGLVTASGAPGVAGAPGPAGGLSVDIVLTSNDTLSGLAVRDGVTPVAGRMALAVGQSAPAQNMPYVIASGAWLPVFTSDADVSDFLGLTVSVLSGTLGASTVWAQRTGATLLGAKTWVRMPDAADKAVVACLVPSGDASGATDTPKINATLAAAKAAGGGTVQLAPGAWYVNDQLVCENTQGVYLIGSCGGASGPSQGTRVSQSRVLVRT